MNIVRNTQALNRSKERRVVLELVEAALSSIQPGRVIPNVLSLENDMLKIRNEVIDLGSFRRIILIGFGKGSAAFSREAEKILGERLQEGYVIDTTSADFARISFTQGTHPLPSQQNYLFTKSLIDSLEDSLSDRDLVLVVVCGGGSAMLMAPDRVSLEKKLEVNRALLKSGADILQMNTVRKHLSRVKGGGLAKILYPAQVVTLIVSDVPGNDLSTVASGPTVLDNTTAEDAWNIIKQFQLEQVLQIKRNDLSETPKDKKYFQNVRNLLILSNQAALSTMQQKALSLGYEATIYTDRLQGEARHVGRNLIEKTPKGTILLAGGETTVKVTGEGRGGRNQEVVLAALPHLLDNTVIASFDSDGWDNSPFAGAIGDQISLDTARSLGLNPELYLNTNNSLEFFERVGDGIVTGRLPTNVADLFIVFRP